MTEIPEADLLQRVAAARAAARAGDPFVNPVLAVALSLGRQLDEGALTLPEVVAALRGLGAAAFRRRAARLAAAVGGTDPASADSALAAVAAHVAAAAQAGAPSTSFDAFREACDRPRAAAVFTAHPTFSLSPEASATLASAACGGAIHATPSLRPVPPTLEDEFNRAVEAIIAGRDALDRLAAALLAEGRAAWPERWTTLDPRPVLLASWVGYDTDGRTDVGWQDTLRLRLRMKELQLSRVAAQLGALPGSCTWALRARVAEALGAVRAQVAACPGPGAVDPLAAQAFARALVGRRDVAMTDPEPLLEMFPDALAGAPDDQVRLALCAVRAGLVAHGLALAHTQVRLNATQLHNAARLRFASLDGSPPSAPARRRALFAAMDEALSRATAEPVDTGALLSEPSSAARLMMTCAQIVKHVDSSQPVRFLIAETESGFTLLAALLLAKLSGVEGHVEISPLFETAEALEQRGALVVEEALRSPHWRAYLRRVGRMALQFGYSDSGRYVGQVQASHLIERLKLRVAELLARYEMTGLEIVLFDTHGEGLGRGGHPDGLAARLAYLNPPAVRSAFAKRGIHVRRESAFQGGDGYLTFGTPALAHAAIARIAEDAFRDPNGGAASDPVYAEGGFASDLFAGARAAMNALVGDPGYAALLGAFGPALLDRTGSRPVVRQSDGSTGSTVRHPRDMRAIPNNAVLQQLGFLANVTHGLGAASSREPEVLAELMRGSPRFSNAMAFPRAALALSDPDVLRGYVMSLDPGTWLDIATRTHATGTTGPAAVARALEELGLGDPARAVFRRLLADDAALRDAWPDGAPEMPDHLFAAHALRLCLMHRVWLLAVAIPEFSPRHGVAREALVQRLLRLDIAPAADLLGEVFPAAAPAGADLDFGEPHAEHRATGYGREHAGIVAPLRLLANAIREASAVVSLECGAFG
ncbi:phosphoenolpyruvate carboxylase [Muricoccus radiodurans]|uniref:phosphoenolpyruvate carboxylase n=1 Tax=Muricoccus radiodurans TaxID=2231721 RepID=UPI003CF0F5E1